MNSKTFKTIATTSIHGQFDVTITVNFQGLNISNAYQCVATIGGIEYDMEYNIAMAPEDRIQAGVNFSKAFSCQIGQSIRCDAKEVSAFIKELRGAALNVKIQDAENYEQILRTSAL